MRKLKPISREEWEPVAQQNGEPVSYRLSLLRNMAPTDVATVAIGGCSSMTSASGVVGGMVVFRNGHGIYKKDDYRIVELGDPDNVYIDGPHKKKPIHYYPDLPTSLSGIPRILNPRLGEK